MRFCKTRTRGAISVYARGDDYHDVIKPRLKKLGRWLIDNAGGDVKVFVDTAPVMEKPLAAAAGLGWQGKHTNLVSRQFGSWLFLGAIFTTLDLPPDAPEGDHCGHCRACLDICPTAAFPAPYRLDARRCISYLTIEHKGPIPREFRPRSAIASMAATIAWRSARGTNSRAPAAKQSWRRGRRCARRGLPIWRGSTMPLSGRCSPRSPVKRIGRDRFVRNVLIAIGNSGDAASPARPSGSSATSRRWSAAPRSGRSSRLDDARLLHCAADRAAAETDPEVVAEWTAARGV